MSHKIFTGHFDARKFCFTHWANLFFADDDPFIIRGANTFWPVNMKILVEKKPIPDFNFCFQKSNSPKKHLSFQKIMQEKMLLKNYVKLIEDVLAHASRTKCRYFKFSARLCCRKKIALFVIFWDFKNSPCWNTIAKSLMSEYLILGGIWECQWII